MRRQRLTAHGSERFRNYGALLERHEKDQRLKKVLRVFTYFLVILIIVMLIVIVVRVERKATRKAPVNASLSYPEFYKT